MSAGYLRSKSRVNVPAFTLPLAMSLPRRPFVPTPRTRKGHVPRARSRYKPHPADLDPEPQYDSAITEQRIAAVRRAKQEHLALYGNLSLTES